MSDALQPFHPSVQTWFREVLGPPSPPQTQGWPLIRQGRNTLIAAPTGSGKTLAGFLWALDGLLRTEGLPDETRVLYVSPLRALSNDIQKNLSGPLAQLLREPRHHVQLLHLHQHFVCPAQHERKLL